MTKFQKEAVKAAVLNVIAGHSFEAAVNEELKGKGIAISNYNYGSLLIVDRREGSTAGVGEHQKIVDILQPYYYDSHNIKVAKRAERALIDLKEVLYSDLGASVQSVEEIPNIKELKKTVTPLIETISKTVDEFRQSGKWLVWLIRGSGKMNLLSRVDGYQAAKDLQEQLKEVKTIIEPELK